VDTALMRHELATAQYHAGQGEAARAGFEAAWANWQRAGAEHNPDALNTLNNWAALSLREGRLDEAERLFAQALALRRAHLPPSAAQAALMNNLGKLMLRRGEAAASLPLLQEAVDMATRFAGASSPHALAAWSGVVEAHTALGQASQARQALQALQTHAAALPNPQDPQRALPDLSWARWHAAQAQWPQAHQRLQAALAHWQAIGPGGAPYLAQARALSARWPPAR
jgi:non-specific serine/threonine protein kinase/serine/threonine-protein kinase